MEAPNGDSRGELALHSLETVPNIAAESYSSSRREGYSSSSRRDDYRSSSSRHEGRHESDRYRDRERGSDRGDRDRDRDRSHRHSEESSHHRSFHRDGSGRDHGSSSSRGDHGSSSRGDYGSSSRGGDYSSSSRDYGSSRSHGEDPYPSSRDRESRYDSRRGGSSRFDGPRGGGNFGSGGYGGRDRKRSVSPTRPRGSTPDLTGVVPIDERKRRLTMWDVKPAGYENVTAEQAKMSGIAFPGLHLLIVGLFPLPGTPRNTNAMTPEALRALAEGKAPPPGPTGSMLAPLDVPKLWALNASNSRQARRLVISKLPPSSTPAEIQNHFNLLVSRLNVYKEAGGEPVKDVKKATSGGMAIVEFTESIYATTILALEDEIDYNGVQLEVRRPANYIVQPPPENEKTPSTDVLTQDVPDSTEKLVIKGLPTYLTSEQALELVETFGAVRGWILVSETDSSESKVDPGVIIADSKGVAFVQFKDPTVTPVALENLNGMSLNDDHTLSVSYACQGLVQTTTAVENPGGAMGMITSLAAERGSENARSRVLLLLNMVTGDDLMDADEYDDILQDVKTEADRFGKVLDLQIPRPLGRSGEGPGVGKVFVRFETEDDCEAALRGIAGRKFSERTVVASFYPEVCPLLFLC